MSNETMQAARIHDYGGPEQIVIEQTPRPEPKAGEVLVRLKAAGVNPADWKMRAGYMKQFRPLIFPWIPGLEGAGTVEAVGPNVTALKAGQAVLGPINNSYAEYAVAPVTDLFMKPEKLSFEEAASVPVGALTAWQAVIDEAQVQPGQRVLVHGGAGGVGLYAVQFARWKGAHVTATASAANADFLRSLGAEKAIDYHATKFEDVVKDVHAVIDTVGGDLVERSLQVIRPGGVFVTAAGRVDPAIGQVHGIRAASAHRADVATLRTIVELLQAKQIVPVVGKVFPLTQARQAQELSQTGHGRGRIVLQID
jgi:NADPH:quinone reductase-like Zn-dependent oxidoreductase